MIKEARVPRDVKATPIGFPIKRLNGPRPYNATARNELLQDYSSTQLSNLSERVTSSERRWRLASKISAFVGAGLFFTPMLSLIFGSIEASVQPTFSDPITHTVLSGITQLEHGFANVGVKDQNLDAVYAVFSPFVAALTIGTAAHTAEQARSSQERIIEKEQTRRMIASPFAKSS